MIHRAVLKRFLCAKCNKYMMMNVFQLPYIRMSTVQCVCVLSIVFFFFSNMSECDGMCVNLCESWSRDFIDFTEIHFSLKLIIDLTISEIIIMDKLNLKEKKKKCDLGLATRLPTVLTKLE